MRQVLAAMPARLDLLRSSGVLATVSERLPGHPNHAIKDAAAALSARWQGRPPPRLAAPEPAAAPAVAPAPQGACCSSKAWVASGGGAHEACLPDVDSDWICSSILCV
jgi:hypothetical protein